MTGPHKMTVGGCVMLLALAALFFWIVLYTPLPTADLIQGLAAR